MVWGVVKYEWFVNEIAALFLGMAIAVGVVGRLSADRLLKPSHGAKDLVTTAMALR